MTHKIIREFHITSKYKGYPLIIDAIDFYISKDGNYIKITKDLYPILSEKYNISTSSVERNIRTVVEACWANNKEAVQNIIGHKTIRCPSNSEFIDAIAYYIIQNKTL